MEIDTVTVYDDIQLLNDNGEVTNTIVASESFADAYVAQNGGSWRHRPTFVPEPEN